jgi:hypothetical protein
MYMAQQLLAMYHSMKFQRMQQDRKPFDKYAPSRTMIFVIQSQNQGIVKRGLWLRIPAQIPSML